MAKYRVIGRCAEPTAQELGAPESEREARLEQEYGEELDRQAYEKEQLCEAIGDVLHDYANGLAHLDEAIDKILDMITLQEIEGGMSNRRRE